MYIIPLFKRGHKGTYHQKMSRKHLQRYVDEFAYRWNTRGDMDMIFADIVQNFAEKGKLTYKELTAEQTLWGGNLKCISRYPET